MNDNVLNIDQQENMADQNNNQQPDAEKEIRIFTQEEVDKIVEKRLNRERKKFSSILSGEDPREAELNAREKAVQKKELQADARGILAEKKLPLEALELLDYTDKKSCDKSIERIEQVVMAFYQSGVNSILKGGEPMKKAPQGGNTPDMMLREAFGLNRK